MTSANKPLQVAIIGASGIGKNHAAWFQKNGAEICAFVGSSPESVETTSGVLQSRLGYAPRGYIELSQLLQDEKPDAVCIASPPQLHFEHGTLCLEHGVHTLCEKPLVYNANQSSAALVAQAQNLNELAKVGGVLLGTQMQYCFLTDTLCRMAAVSPDEVETISVEIETKNMKPGRSHETIWIELAPHPLSVLQKLFPGAQLLSDSIECRIDRLETVAQFQVQRPDKSKLKAHITARCNPSTPAPSRRFTINSVTVDYAGRNNERGEFLTTLAQGNETTEMPDLVDILIGNFLAACKKEKPLFVTGEDGALNVEWLLEILDQGQRI